MMQNIRLLNVCEARRHKKANDLYHLVQGKNLHFNPYVYILYCKSNMLYNLTPSPDCYPVKFLMGMLEQPSSETVVHNVMAIS